MIRASNWLCLLVSRIAICAGILAPAAPLCAQEADLRSAISSRIKPLEDGQIAEYDAQNQIKAGYFRIRIEPIGLNSATICPDAVLDAMPKADRVRWKAAGSAIVDTVFKRNFLWGITASIVLRPDAATSDTAAVTLSLITIKDPKRGNCEIKIGGETGASTVDYQSFLVPIGTGPLNYDERIQVNLKSAYTSETDKAQVKKLWDSVLTPIVGAVFAPAAAVVGAVADQGQAAIINEMDRKVIASYPIVFNADPGAGNHAKRIFLKLDFVNLPGPGGVPTEASGGISIALEHQASVFLGRDRYYRPITTPSSDLLNTVIRTASGDRTILSQLSQNAADQLRVNATSVDLFEGGCSGARDQLVAKGLSRVDTAVFIWALAFENRNLGPEKLWNIPCIRGTVSDLAKVGIVEPQKPVRRDVRLAALVEMHKAMDNLATMTQTSIVIDDLTQRFAPTIRLIADSDTRDKLGLQGFAITQDKASILQLLATRFSRVGCYAPRLSSPDLTLPMRPDFQPLTGLERVSGAILLLGGRDGTAGTPIVASFKFGDVAAGETAQINTISLTQRGTDTEPLISEITDHRRPASCNETWMDSIFAKP